jgi:UDP-N-acetylmuramate-alanine ligase
MKLLLVLRRFKTIGKIAESRVVYKDFAHSPSKVPPQSSKEQYPDRILWFV